MPTYHPSILGDFDEPDDDLFIESALFPLTMPEPTMARPSSEEKIRVLMQRLERGEHLHHPDDYQEKNTLPITMEPTGADRAAMGSKLSGNGKPKKQRSARIGFYREPK